MDPQLCADAGGHIGSPTSTITGFRQDEDGHWIAELTCGHSQHMRHQPPWQVRPWVLTPEGRAGFVGVTIPCVKCETPQTDMDTDALHEIRRIIEEGENAGDAERYVALMDDDVVLVVPDYPMQEGKPASADFIRGLAHFMRENLNRQITYTSREVQVLGDLAFDRGTFAFTVSWKQGSPAEEVRGKYFWLCRRGDAGWKLWRVVVTRDEDEPSDDE